jgi:hypothetical protein
VTERSGYSSRIPSVLIMLFVMSWSLFFEFSDNALLLWLFCSPGFVVCVVCCISGCFSSLPVVVVAAAKTREGCFVTRRRCACIEEARAPLRSREKESKGMTACWFGEMVAYSWDQEEKGLVLVRQAHLMNLKETSRCEAKGASCWNQGASACIGERGKHTLSRPKRLV